MFTGFATWYMKVKKHEITNYVLDYISWIPESRFLVSTEMTALWNIKWLNFLVLLLMNTVFQMWTVFCLVAKNWLLQLCATVWIIMLWVEKSDNATFKVMWSILILDMTFLILVVKNTCLNIYLNILLPA